MVEALISLASAMNTFEFEREIFCYVSIDAFKNAWQTHANLTIAIVD